MLAERNYKEEDLKVFKDGDQFCIVRKDFVNLQESPAEFFHEDSWQGRILQRWYGVPNPLIHLSWVEWIRLWNHLGANPDRSL
jgi:hypothetical protein